MSLIKKKHLYKITLHSITTTSTITETNKEIPPINDNQTNNNIINTTVENKTNSDTSLDNMTNSLDSIAERLHKLKEDLNTSSQSEVPRITPLFVDIEERKPIPISTMSNEPEETNLPQYDPTAYIKSNTAIKTSSTATIEVCAKLADKIDVELKETELAARRQDNLLKQIIDFRKKYMPEWGLPTWLSVGASIGFTAWYILKYKEIPLLPSMVSMLTGKGGSGVGGTASSNTSTTANSPVVNYNNSYNFGPTPSPSGVQLPTASQMSSLSDKTPPLPSWTEISPSTALLLGVVFTLVFSKFKRFR